MEAGVFGIYMYLLKDNYCVKSCHRSFVLCGQQYYAVEVANGFAVVFLH